MLKPQAGKLGIPGPYESVLTCISSILGTSWIHIQRHLQRDSEIHGF